MGETIGETTRASEPQSGFVVKDRATGEILGPVYASQLEAEQLAATHAGFRPVYVAQMERE